jgi:cytochrome c1
MLRPLTGMLVIAAFLAILAGPNAPAQEMEVDTFTGLKMSDDWELVRNNCIACHSLKLVTQQRGSATQWLSVIRWMQAKQNLWQLDPDTENRIINYLAENYPPQAEQRRAALAPQLMPPNPYAADSK